MKLKISLLLILAAGMVCFATIPAAIPLTLAQSSTTAFSQVVDTYRSSLQASQLANREYQQLQSLITFDQALLTTQQSLVARNQVWIAHLDRVAELLAQPYSLSPDVVEPQLQLLAQIQASLSEINTTLLEQDISTSTLEQAQTASVANYELLEDTDLKIKHLAQYDQLRYVADLISANLNDTEQQLADSASLRRGYNLLRTEHQQTLDTFTELEAELLAQDYKPSRVNGLLTSQYAALTQTHQQLYELLQ